MTKYEIYQKELNYLYEAKRVLEKYGVNTRNLDVRIIKCLNAIKLFDRSDKEC